MVDESKLDALEELKANRTSALAGLQTEHSLLQRSTKSIEADLDRHKTMLQKALEERTALQASNSSNEDLKATLDIIKAATLDRKDKQANGMHPSLEKHIADLIGAMSGGREQLVQHKEVHMLISFSNLERIKMPVDLVRHSNGTRIRNPITNTQLLTPDHRSQRRRNHKSAASARSR